MGQPCAISAQEAKAAKITPVLKPSPAAVAAREDLAAAPAVPSEADLELRAAQVGPHLLSSVVLDIVQFKAAMRFRNRGILLHCRFVPPLIFFIYQFHEEIRCLPC